MSALHCLPSAPNADDDDYVSLTQHDDSFISLLSCAFTYVTDNIKCPPPSGYEWGGQFNPDTIRSSDIYDTLTFTVNARARSGVITIYRKDSIPFTASMTSHLKSLGFWVDGHGAQWERADWIGAQWIQPPAPLPVATPAPLPVATPAPLPVATPAEPAPLPTLESEKLRFKHIKKGDILRHSSGATYDVVNTYPNGDFTIKKSETTERIKVQITQNIQRTQIFIQSSSRWTGPRQRGLGESKNYTIV
jgi:hypothetical protein